LEVVQDSRRQPHGITTLKHKPTNNKHTPMKTTTTQTTSAKSLRDLIAKSNPLGGARKQEQNDK
jgi:hypothetical protein